MDELTVISAKIPDAVYKELVLRVPNGERSHFIREAIAEKLEKTPRPDKIFELERKISELQDELSTIKKALAELELLTYDKGKINPYAFCIDTMDQKIVDYLLDRRGATTTELAGFLNTNRWFVLNRLRKIERASKKQLGKPIVEYYPGEKAGKRKAWWIIEDLIEPESS